ncbi:MAG: hypothetical protein HDS56_09175 [Barnesiella sp.]|nr:hypothetical protein [Bacteroidales bacterium]MBD5251328.1 hypothetical protein [Barnesiella sp.]MBD5254316.1 hypothetical protein [Barnesiella sp.]
MKKFYSLLLSCAVAVSAFAQAPLAAKLDKTAKFGEIKEYTISKIANAEKQIQNPKSMNKAPKAYAEESNSIAGTYLFQGYLTDDNGNADEAVISTFEITAPDADGNVKVKNFLADFYGVPTNDLDGKVYTETAQGQDFTIFAIGGKQTILTYNNNDYVMFLYGPFAEGGATGIFSNDIQFIVFDNAMVSYWSNQGLFIGYSSGNSGYRGTMLVGYSDNGVTIYTPNTTMTAEQYASDTEIVPAEYPLYSEYVEEYGAIVTLNFGGSAEDIVWYVDTDDCVAQSLDAYAGSITVSQPVQTENGVIPAGTYPYYMLNDQDDQHFYTNGTLSRDAETGNTNLNIESVMFLSELGWIEKFENVVVKFPFNILGEDAGINNITVDNNQNAPVEYFNLQGVRVENPSAGLYIRRQGNQTIKVLVK